MRAASLLLSLLVVGLAPAALADDLHKGTIVGTGTVKTNASTAAPFVMAPGGTYAIQCDAAANVSDCSSSATVTTAATGTSGRGVKLAADQLYTVSCAHLAGTRAYVAVLVTGSCYVYALRERR